MDPNLVYLAQTDTTVGFLSQSAGRLAKAKGRSVKKPFIKALPSLRSVSEVGRVPMAHRRFVRRARKMSFILPNGRSFRVVTGPHRDFVARFGWCWSTSANRHGEPFDEAYARDVCDVVVESKEGFRANPPSILWKVGRAGKVKVR